MNRIVCREAFRTLTLSSITIFILPYHHRHHNHHQHPLIIIIIIINQQRQLQQKQLHHHQYHLYYYRINITIITIIIIIIITKPFISSSSSSSSSSSLSSSSLLQLSGTKTCWKRGGVYARFGGTPLLFLFHNPQKRYILKKGLNFNMQKITSQSKLYIDCNDCGMAQYMYFDYKITFTPCWTF